MLLEVHERMQLLNLMPVEGGFEELKAIRRQREILSFTLEEKNILELESVKQPDGSIQTNWKGENAPQVVKDVPIDEYMTNFFRKRLAEMESNGKLTEQSMSLYEKFVIMYK